MIKLIVPNEADFSVVAYKIALISEKSLVLTPSNVTAVINSALVNREEKYQGYMFVVDGRLILASKPMSVFNIVVADMIRVWKHLDWTFIIIVPADLQYVSEGLKSIDKMIRSYVLTAERWLDDDVGISALGGKG